MRNALLRRAALCVALLVSTGCARGPEVPGFPEKATEAYDAFLAEPNATSYERFISENRKVTIGRETPHDAIGVLVQVRALEVQSMHAQATGDLGLAIGVVDRIREIEERELLGVYDDALPGAAERLTAARDRVFGMTE